MKVADSAENSGEHFPPPGQILKGGEGVGKKMPRPKITREGGEKGGAVTYTAAAQVQTGVN